jgi:hypothetical protein
MKGKARHPVRGPEAGVTQRAAAGQLDDQPATIFSIHDRLPVGALADHLADDDVTEERASGLPFTAPAITDRPLMASSRSETAGYPARRGGAGHARREPRDARGALPKVAGYQEHANLRPQGAACEIRGDLCAVIQRCAGGS